MAGGCCAPVVKSPAKTVAALPLICTGPRGIVKLTLKGRHGRCIHPPRWNFYRKKKKVPDGKLVTHQSPFPLPFQRRPWKRGLSIVSLSKIHAAPTLYEKLDEPSTDLLVFRVSVRGEKKNFHACPIFFKTATKRRRRRRSFREFSQENRKTLDYIFVTR